MRNIKLILVALSMLPAPAQALDVPFFPRLTATTLEQQRVVLPRDFAGERNVVVVAFERRQRPDIDGWTSWLNKMEAARPEVRWYELPALSKMAGTVAGWFIAHGMRRGTGDATRRRRTIPLHVDKDRFRQHLGLSDGEGEIHILVVTRRGDILARTSGGFSEDKAARIAAALAGEDRGRR